MVSPYLGANAELSCGSSMLRRFSAWAWKVRQLQRLVHAALRRGLIVGAQLSAAFTARSAVNVWYNLQQDTVDDSGKMKKLNAYRESTRSPGLLLSALIPWLYIYFISSLHSIRTVTSCFSMLLSSLTLDNSTIFRSNSLLLYPI